MARKDRPAKMPRKVAGVKIPKELRKSAIGDFLGSRVGQALVTEAVIAGAALVASEAVKQRGGSRGKAKAKALSDGGEVSLAPTTLALAFTEAGRAFAHALHRPAPEAKSPDDNFPADFDEAQIKAVKPRRTTKAAAAEPTARPH